AENVALAPADSSACADWAAANAIDLTIIGPENYLAGGIADVFTARGLRVFGPSAAATRIESSKAFAKRLMVAASVPTPRAEIFDNYDEAIQYLDRYEAEGNSYPLIIKADGLAAGKGVVKAENGDEARATLDDFMVRRTLGEAGTTVLIEEYITGTELSLFVLCDGKRIYPLAPACDYKRALDNDEGGNTGGMGAYSPPAFATPELLARIETTIVRPVVAALAAQGAPFRGLLYAGLMVSDDGLPQVIEFNARFGDPETQVVLPRLESDLLELCAAVADGALDRVSPPAWSDAAACGVVVASRGYPGEYAKGFPITGLDTLDPDIIAFHAGTAREPDGQLVTTGGRVLTLVARGATVAEARARVYANIDRVYFEGARWRNDIGARER
ncbi:MAG TPA: phosphoribosylamine--glycine ligase, partial [Ktedonobacterales bacterium]|nr:phosphoribosylamine--glycine ligase [Ktedonobacterales bacterium]